MMENNGNKLIACINKMYLIRTVLRVLKKISILFASWEVIDAEQIKKVDNNDWGMIADWCYQATDPM